MGVVSNTTNPRFMKENEMQAAGLKPYFEFTIYSSDTPYRKPHPSIFELAIESLDMKPEEILFHFCKTSIPSSFFYTIK